MYRRLTKSVLIGKKLPALLLGYSVFECRLAYNKELDKSAELQSDPKKESKDFLYLYT